MLPQDYLEISFLTDFIKEAQHPKNSVMDLDAWCRDKAYELYKSEELGAITKSEREELQEQIDGLEDDINDKDSAISNLEDRVDELLNENYKLAEANKILSKDKELAC